MKMKKIVKEHIKTAPTRPLFMANYLELPNRPWELLKDGDKMPMRQTTLILQYYRV